MNKKVIIIISIIAILGVILIMQINTIKPKIYTDKQNIYDMFNNFPKSNKIYYSYQNKYSDFSIGPTIYQLYILAELEEESYNTFIKKLELEKLDIYDIKINPDKKIYNWQNIKNTNIIESKNNEIASIENIYLDKKAKTIYIKAIGGN